MDGDELLYDRQNMTAVRQRVDTLMKGCHGKTGCKTARCSCRKKAKTCAEGCECVNCCNRSSAQPTEDEHLIEVSIEESVSEQDPYQQLLQEVEETMQMVFGEYDADYAQDIETDEEFCGDV